MSLKINEKRIRERKASRKQRGEADARTVQEALGAETGMAIMA